MTNARIERMLRELHAGPPLRFMEDVFSLTEIVKEQVATIRESNAEANSAPLGAPALAR